MSTALTPKISTGRYKGNMISASRTPPRRAPSISAAPTAPTRLKEGVPRISASINTRKPSLFKFSNTANTGVVIINGKPVVSHSTHGMRPSTLHVANCSFPSCFQFFASGISFWISCTLQPSGCGCFFSLDGRSCIVHRARAGLKRSQ